MLKGPLPKFSYMLKTTHLEKRDTRIFNIKSQIGISKEPSGKGRKRVKIAYFCICFQWYLCQIIVLFDKSNLQNYFFFIMPWNIKIHLEAYKHSIPPVHKIWSNEGTGAWASLIRRDLSCCSGGEAMLLLILTFLFLPTRSKWSNFSLTPIRKWLCYNTFLLIQMRHILGKAENTSMGLSTQVSKVISGLAREQAARIML